MPGAPLKLKTQLLRPKMDVCNSQGPGMSPKLDAQPASAAAAKHDTIDRMAIPQPRSPGALLTLSGRNRREKQPVSALRTDS
jgi:hypothetical protein